MSHDLPPGAVLGLPTAAPRRSPTAVPLVEELDPGLRPAQVFQHLAGLPRLLFLDSALSHPSLGRYSFLSADPYDFLWSRGRQVFTAGAAVPLPRTDPFAEMNARLAAHPADRLDGLPPFQGGAAGMFGYDLCHHLERLPRPQYDEFEVPDLAVGFYDWVVAFDHVEGRGWLISTGLPEREPRRRRRWAERRLLAVKRLLARNTERRARSGKPGREIAIAAPHYPVNGLGRGLFSDFDRSGYLAGVRRAIEYIHAGDCFQVNFAQRLLTPAVVPPFDLYLRLRERNPATFAGYFDLGEYVVASASPERFLKLEDEAVETRPIKGTRPRGASPAEDEARGRELLASAKDRAENVMIVDLLRNDLGRVCRYGSVRVPELCRLETYGFVHHLVSAVQGRMRDGLGPVDLLRAAFPGGSVTGAPKIRAMEIIAELEPTARGPYCGCLGYIGFEGSMDLNILIRTFTVGRGWVQFPVGGGIVADSVPEREYEETWHKAEGLLRALR
jgi:para-aminobenzoate synthetase component 1